MKTLKGVYIFFNMNTKSLSNNIYFRKTNGYKRIQLDAIFITFFVSLQEMNKTFKILPKKQFLIT